MKKKLLAWKAAESSSSPDGSRAGSQFRCNRSYTLDSVVSRRERRDTRPPLQPRHRVVNRAADGYDFLTDDGLPENIYDLIPSSPLQPPSSPAAECRFFSDLPSTSKVKRSLEYACARDRAERRKRAHMKKRAEEENWDIPGLDLDDSEESETEAEDLITPDSSLQSMTVPLDLLNTPRRADKGKAKRVLCADEEAARALLAFRGA